MAGNAVLSGLPGETGQGVRALDGQLAQTAHPIIAPIQHMLLEAGSMRQSIKFINGNVAVGGSGLGLPIVKRVAELNNVQLRLRNLPEGGLEAVLEWTLPPTLNS